MQSPIDTTAGWQVERDGADAYERYLASAFAPWARRLVERAGIQPGHRVLDVACGTGVVARSAAERTGGTGHVVGLDLNAEMLRVARAAPARGGPIEWRQGDSAQLPFADGAFDVVTCEQAIQFFPDPVAALGEMHRVLVPGGRAAVSVCRPLRFAPAYLALAAVLDRHLGEPVGAIMRSPFANWETEDYRALFVRAGFADPRLSIEVWPLTYPSSDEFLRREASASPLAGAVAAMADADRRALLADLRQAVAEHADDEGVACPVQVYVAVAAR
jgi:SAM-dependent methyltransferase